MFINITLTKLKLRRQLGKVHNERVRQWQQANKGVPIRYRSYKPTLSEAVDMIVEKGLQHPDVLALLEPPTL